MLRHSTVLRCVTVLDLRCREPFFQKTEISGGGEGGGVFLFLYQLQFSPLKTLQERRNLSSPAVISHEAHALVTMTNMEHITPYISTYYLIMGNQVMNKMLNQPIGNASYSR